MESFLIHIETLPSGRDDKYIPIRISGSSFIMQLEPVLIRNEIFTLSRNYAVDCLDIGIMCLARSILLLFTKNNDDRRHTIPKSSSVHFAPNSRAVFNGEKDCGRAF